MLLDISLYIKIVLFVSTGPIGLVSLLVAKAMGASQVVITGNAWINTSR